MYLLCSLTRQRGILLAFRLGTSALVAVLLGGCVASPDPNSLSFDPLEERNRKSHSVNKSFDRAAFGPMARAYGEGLPPPVRRGVTNLQQNWSQPSYVLHYSLQGKPELAGRSLMRFGVNTLFGFGGLLDVGAELGMENRETNFDETFKVYGVPEGAYVEVPLGGPGTQRDWTGWVLDSLTDPVLLVTTTAGGYALVGIAGLDILNDRYELDTVLDELYNNSADSYTAQRITYLQNMRARLNDGTGVEALEDIYVDY